MTSGKSMHSSLAFSGVGTPFGVQPRRLYTASFSFSYSASRYFLRTAIFSSVVMRVGSMSRFSLSWVS